MNGNLHIYTSIPKPPRSSPEERERSEALPFREKSACWCVQLEYIFRELARVLQGAFNADAVAVVVADANWINSAEHPDREL